LLNAHFISIKFGGRKALAGAQFSIARFVSIALGGRIALVGAPRFNHIALGGRIALVGAQFFIAYFISIAFPLARRTLFASRLVAAYSSLARSSDCAL
jgi:hypothetical protein